jgi:hypothetical protein
MTETPEVQAKLIQSIKTPIGFFALVVVVIESFLAWNAAWAGAGWDRTFLIISGVALLASLMLVVAFLAYSKPWVLSGQPPPPPPAINVIELKPPPYSTTTEPIRYFLRGIKETYLRTLYDAGWDTPKHLRVNVMLVVSHGSGASAEQVLVLRYVDYPAHFKEEEYGSFYRKGEAKCGSAWKLLQQTYYAVDRDEEEARFVKMRATNPVAYSHKSVLSTPIIIQDQCIAVLNLDSDEPSSTTWVHRDMVQNVFYLGAKEIVPLLFPMARSS